MSRSVLINWNFIPPPSGHQRRKILWEDPWDVSLVKEEEHDRWGCPQLQNHRGPLPVSWWCCLKHLNKELTDLSTCTLFLQVAKDDQWWGEAGRIQLKVLQEDHLTPGSQPVQRRPAEVLLHHCHTGWNHKEGRCKTPHEYCNCTRTDRIMWSFIVCCCAGWVGRSSFNPAQRWNSDPSHWTNPIQDLQFLHSRTVSTKKQSCALWVFCLVHLPFSSFIQSAACWGEYQRTAVWENICLEI